MPHVTSRAVSLRPMKSFIIIIAFFTFVGTATANNVQDNLRDEVLQAINLPFPSEATNTRTQLSALGPPATPFIVEFIAAHENLHPIKKTFLVDIIAAMKGEQADSALLELLSDNDSYVRGLAVTYLGKRKLTSSIPYLIKLLSDKEVYKTINQTDPAAEQDVLVRDVAIEALQATTGVALAHRDSKEEQVKAWLRWCQKQHRAKGICFSPETFAQSSEKTIKVQAAIDGKVVKSEDIQIEIRVNERIITPQITKGGFSADVLSWVDKNERDIEVEIKYKRYELKLLDLSKDHFQGRWTISITTAPHLDKRDLPNAENVDYAYMIEFMPINGEGIVLSNVKYKTLSAAPSAQVAINSAQAQDRKVKVLRFEVDKKEIKSSFKIILYLNDKEIEPVRDGNSFFVPQEVDNSIVTVRFISSGYDLLFHPIYPAKFDTDWIIGVDKKPFDADNVSPEETRNVKMVYYAQFISREGDGTILVVSVLKKKRPSVEASRESSSLYFSSLGAIAPIDGDPKPCPYSSVDARSSIYTGKSNNKNYCQ